MNFQKNWNFLHFQLFPIFYSFFKLKTKTDQYRQRLCLSSGTFEKIHTPAGWRTVSSASSDVESPELSSWRSEWHLWLLEPSWHVVTRFRSLSRPVCKRANNCRHLRNNHFSANQKIFKNLNEFFFETEVSEWISKKFNGKLDNFQN